MATATEDSDLDESLLPMKVPQPSSGGDRTMLAANKRLSIASVIDVVTEDDTDSDDDLLGPGKYTPPEVTPTAGQQHGNGHANGNGAEVPPTMRKETAGGGNMTGHESLDSIELTQVEPTLNLSADASIATDSDSDLALSSSMARDSSLATISTAVLRHRRPKRLSKYILGGVMGEGAFCTVRDAIDISKHQLERVAVKMLRPADKVKHAADRAHTAETIANEVEMLQRFHHPNVIRALDCFSRHSTEYVVLPIAVCSLAEFIAVRREDMAARQAAGMDSACVSRTVSVQPGHSLAPATPLRFSSRVLVPASLAKDIVVQVIHGLLYLHGQNVFHNDLKPSNVLLFGDGTVKIADLGCAGAVFNVGRHGTPAFVSPQVVARLVGHELPGIVSADEDVCPKKNDAWALGVLLYQLLTGRLPTQGSDAEDSISDESLGGEASAPSQFTVYRDIVYKDIDFFAIREEDTDGVLQIMGDDGVPISPAAIRGLGSGEAGARSLVAALLNKNQRQRIDLEQALQHPWLSGVAAPSPRGEHPVLPPPPNPTNKRVIGLPEARMRRVFDVKEMRSMIEKDYVRHMQLAAEVCFILRMALPPELYRRLPPANTAPPLVPPPRPFHVPSTTSVLHGAIDGGIFMKDEQMRHYAGKGCADADVITLRPQQFRRPALFVYVDAILRLCEDVASAIPGDTRAASVHSRRESSARDSSPEGTADQDKASAKGCCCH